MTSTFIAIALAAVVLSLWIRRDSWGSHWETGANLNVALQGCALLFMSPWASATIGAPLHRIFGMWNVQHLLGHLCLIVAVMAIIYHVLLRIADAPTVRKLFGRHVVGPAKAGVLVLVAMFVVADEGYHADLFPAHVSTIWFAAYWLVLSGLLVYLLSYVIRVLAIVREDSRSAAIANVYLIAVALGLSAGVIQLGTAWAGIDITVPVWLCACLGAILSAYGSARSWQARINWFTPGRLAPPQSTPPQSTPPQSTPPQSAF